MINNAIAFEVSYKNALYKFTVIIIIIIIIIIYTLGTYDAEGV